MPLYLLALDPSTDKTGVAILDVESPRLPLLVAYGSFDGFELTNQPPSRTTLMDRLERICETRIALASWLTQQEVSLSFVAYETQSGRGHASSEALVMAVGSYLTLTSLRRLPPIEVNRSAGCGAVGASKVYAERAGTTAAEKAVKRARLKAAVIAGVNARMGLSLTSEQDAEADAIAVGLAGALKLPKVKATRKKTSC